MHSKTLQLLGYALMVFGVIGAAFVIATYFGYVPTYLQGNEWAIRLYRTAEGTDAFVSFIAGAVLVEFNEPGKQGKLR